VSKSDGEVYEASMEPCCQNKTLGTSGIPRRPNSDSVAGSDDGQQGNNPVTMEYV